MFSKGLEPKKDHDPSLMNSQDSHHLFRKNRNTRHNETAIKETDGLNRHSNNSNNSNNNDNYIYPTNSFVRNVTLNTSEVSKQLTSSTQQTTINKALCFRQNTTSQNMKTPCTSAENKMASNSSSSSIIDHLWRKTQRIKSLTSKNKVIKLSSDSHKDMHTEYDDDKKPKSAHQDIKTKDNSKLNSWFTRETSKKTFKNIDFDNGDNNNEDDNEDDDEKDNSNKNIEVEDIGDGSIDIDDNEYNNMSSNTKTGNAKIDQDLSKTEMKGSNSLKSDAHSHSNANTGSKSLPSKPKDPKDALTKSNTHCPFFSTTHNNNSSDSLVSNKNNINSFTLSQDKFFRNYSWCEKQDIFYGNKRQMTQFSLLDTMNNTDHKQVLVNRERVFRYSWHLCDPAALKSLYKTIEDSSRQASQGLTSYSYSMGDQCSRAQGLNDIKGKDDIIPFGRRNMSLNSQLIRPNPFSDFENRTSYSTKKNNINNSNIANNNANSLSKVSQGNNAGNLNAVNNKSNSRLCFSSKNNNNSSAITSGSCGLTLDSSNSANCNQAKKLSCGIQSKKAEGKDVGPVVNNSTPSKQKKTSSIASDNTSKSCFLSDGQNRRPSISTRRESTRNRSVSESAISTEKADTTEDTMSNNEEDEFQKCTLENKPDAEIKIPTASVSYLKQKEKHKEKQKDGKEHVILNDIFSDMTTQGGDNQLKPSTRQNTETEQNSYLLKGKSSKNYREKRSGSFSKRSSKYLEVGSSSKNDTEPSSPCNAESSNFAFTEKGVNPVIPPCLDPLTSPYLKQVPYEASVKTTTTTPSTAVPAIKDTIIDSKPSIKKHLYLKKDKSPKYQQKSNFSGNRSSTQETNSTSKSTVPFIPANLNELAAKFCDLSMTRKGTIATDTKVKDGGRKKSAGGADLAFTSIDAVSTDTDAEKWPEKAKTNNRKIRRQLSFPYTLPLFGASQTTVGNGNLPMASLRFDNGFLAPVPGGDGDGDDDGDGDGDGGGSDDVDCGNGGKNNDVEGQQNHL